MHFALRILLFLTFLSSYVSAQNPNYQGLLWQISGNELEKPSYLYGTMHVSERVAFHLSDVFFEKLLQTDYVALESNPETWLEERAKNSENFIYYNQSVQRNLYNAFSLERPEKRDLAQMLRMNSYLANGILYRTQESRRNFQEQTYLDMFLFQAARRTHREVFALENSKEARELVNKATRFSREEDIQPWAKKLVKNSSYGEAMQEAYRTGDLDRLDSLNFGFNSQEFMEYMLYKRNENMVVKMDSLLQSGVSLFSGVGAAHLPGDQGMIDLLRQRGYTVQPLMGEFNSAARNQKEKLDTLFLPTDYPLQYSSDSLVQVKAPTKLYATGGSGFEYAYSLDVVNGAQVYVLRQNWNDYLATNSTADKRKKIDSLFFENIPGSILEKKEIEVSGYPAFHIKNRTANGDHQEHLTIITPLELIHVSLLGQKTYATKMPDWWKSVAIRKGDKDAWTTYEPESKHFRVRTPPYTKVINQNGVNTEFLPKEVYAYDSKKQEYFFLIERNISEWGFLEDSGFEQQMIHDAIYEKVELDSANTRFVNGSFYSESKQKKPFLRLKSVIHGSNYFLLGTNSKSNTFFDSFAVNEPIALDEWENWENSTMGFTAKAPYEIEEQNFPYDDGLRDEEKVNHFDEKGEREVVLLSGGKSVEVRSTRFHAYDEFPTLDSLWSEMARRNRELLSFEIRKQKKGTLKSIPIWEAEYGDTASLQKIKARYYLKGNTLFSIKSVVAEDYQNEDPNLEYFFANFEPSDTLQGRSIFAPKTQQFFLDIKSPYDSIRYSAQESFEQLEFKNADAPKLMALVDSMGLAAENKKFYTKIIAAMGELKHPELVAYLSQTYRRNVGNADAQIGILAALAKQDIAPAYDSIVQLMREDLPLTNIKSREFLSLFNQMKKNASNNSALLNVFMNFIPIPEYQYHILDWLGEGIRKKEVALEELEPYWDQILFNAQLQIKRAQAKVQRSYSKDEPVYPYKFAELEAYLQIFRPVWNEKEVAALRTKIQELNAPSLQMAMALQMGLADKAIRADVVEEIGAIPRFAIELYDSLYANNKLHALPKTLDLNRLVDYYARKESKLPNAKEEDKLRFYGQETHSFGGQNWVIRLYQAKDTETIYGRKRNVLLGLGFWLDKKGKLVPKSVLSELQYYQIDDDLPKVRKKIRNAILFKDKKRVANHAQEVYEAVEAEAED